jgi:hypothetical protein
MVLSEYFLTSCTVLTRLIGCWNWSVFISGPVVGTVGKARWMCDSPPLPEWTTSCRWDVPAVGTTQVPVYRARSALCTCLYVRFLAIFVLSVVVYVCVCVWRYCLLSLFCFVLLCSSYVRVFCNSAAASQRGESCFSIPRNITVSRQTSCWLSVSTLTQRN